MEEKRRIESCTAVIKTFERPEKLQNLVDSIRGKYPSMPILVANDSAMPTPVRGASSVWMPYDSGLAAGRNLLADLVETEYCLILDDDFLFVDGTDIGAMVGLLEDSPLDILGGSLQTPSGGRASWQRVFYLHANRLYLKATPYARLGCVNLVDICYNFFVARPQTLRDVRWDEKLKLTEHTDFFLRAKAAGVLTGVCADIVVGHRPGNDSEVYRTHRRRGVF